VRTAAHMQGSLGRWRALLDLKRITSPTILALI
jgi:hypothetical protein